MAFRNIPVTSSCFARIEYDDDSGELAMTFQDGRQYIIPSIPAIEVERWTQAGSPGGYFNSFVRGNY